MKGKIIWIWNSGGDADLHLAGSSGEGVRKLKEAERRRSPPRPQ